MPLRQGDAWRRFGRHMLVGALGVLAFVVLSLVALGALISSVFGSAGFIAVAGAVGVVAVVILGSGLLLLRGVQRTWWPVRELVDAAASLADGDYAARVDVERASPTVRPVAASFNELARRLQEAEEQRRRLLADLGHELRTPLTVVRGEIEAMLDGVHQPDPEHLAQLLDEVTVMERLIEDLRTLSLAEAGTLALHTEPTDLEAVLEDVADSYRRVASEDGIVLVVEQGPQGREVDVDPVRIREIVTNLVVNALRAMPDGGVLTLATRREPQWAVLEVRDTGIGMDAAEAGHAFDRFHKGTTSSGSGLGLTISRDLTAAHGGAISMTSAPGEGTTVEVRLPA